MRIYKLREQLLHTKSERKKHLNALKKVFADKAHQELFKFLYENLNIIDAKSSTLLAYNSVIFAAISIFIVFSSDSLVVSLVFFIAMFLIVISGILCLTVVWIHWSTTQDLNDIDKHIDILLSVRYKRTLKYRIAWYLSLWTALIILVTVFYQIISRSNY